MMRKRQLFLNLITSQTGIQIITIHVLSSISRSNGNKTIEFGQLIDYNIKNLLHEKLCTKSDRQPSPRLFFRKYELSIFLNQ